MQLILIHISLQLQEAWNTLSECDGRLYTAVTSALFMRRASEHNAVVVYNMKPVLSQRNRAFRNAAVNNFAVFRNYRQISSSVAYAHKRRAEAVQTARSRCKELPIQYVIVLGLTKGKYST